MAGPLYCKSTWGTEATFDTLESNVEPTWQAWSNLSEAPKTIKTIQKPWFWLP